MKHLIALLLTTAPAFAIGTVPEAPQPEPEPPAVEQPAPETEPRAEEDNWTCRDGLHRIENRAHLCVKKRKGKRINRVTITDQTYTPQRGGK